MLNSDELIFTFSHKTELSVVWAASIFSYVYFAVDYFILTERAQFFSTINEKTSEIPSTNFKTRVAQNCITFSCFTPTRWLWKQANSLLQLSLKSCVARRAVQRHAVLCVASNFAQKETTGQWPLHVKMKVMAIDQSQREGNHAGSAKWLRARKFIG